MADGHLTYIASDFLGRKIFGVGAEIPNYPLHVEMSERPDYGPWDTDAMFGRRHSVSLAGPDHSQNAAVVVHEAYYDTGTPWALAVVLRSRVKTSNGSAAILGRVEKEPGSADISFGIHGEGHNRALSGACIGINAETSNLGDPASITELIGISSNAGVGGGHVGTLCPVKGLQVAVSHLGDNVLGFGAQIHTSIGKHAYGLRIADAGGTFTIPVSIHSSRSAASVFEMINQADGLGPAPNQIQFGRAPSAVQGMIESDIISAGSFAEGYVDLYTNRDGKISKAVRWDNNGNQFMQRGYVAQSTTTQAASETVDPGQFGFVKLTPGSPRIVAVIGCNAANAGRELTIAFETYIQVEASAAANLARAFMAIPGTVWKLISNGSVWLETARSLS